MKKSVYLFTALALFLTPVAVSAQGSGNGDGGDSSQGNTEQNQNQEETNNQGENSQMQVNAQNEENEGEENSQSSDGNGSTSSAQQSGNSGSTSSAQKQSGMSLLHGNMNAVQSRIESLSGYTFGEEVGEKVKVVVRQQNNSQEQISKQLNKIETRSKFMKFLVGTDHTAVKELKGQMEQNELQIKSLRELKTQVQNESEETMIQETVDALVAQNTALEERVAEEEGTFSLFGWLAKLFV